MKKNIGYINLDASTISWLMKHLPQSDLRSGIEQLVRQEYSSLMIEAEEGMEALAEDVMQCGSLKIYPRQRRVERDGQPVSLTPKEYDILVFLAQNRGEVFTKEEIYQAVWEENYVMDDSNIMAFIRKLRKKIEPNPDAPEYILTIWGVGYKFREF